MIKVVEVQPRSQEWDLFLNMSVKYFNESWPNQFERFSADETKKDYSSELIKRIQQGGRGLFLLETNDGPVGLANCYINDKTLKVAEFYIDPSYRKKGLGRDFLGQIVEWGKSKGAQNLSVDVDINLSVANAFWSSLGLEKKITDRFNYSGFFGSI